MNIQAIVSLQIILDNAGNFAGDGRPTRRMLGDIADALSGAEVIKFIVREKLTGAVAANRVDIEAGVGHGAK